MLTVAAVALTASPAAKAKLARLRTAKLARWLPEAAGALTVLIFVGFAIRPLVQTVAGETNPTSIAYVAELQKLAGLPIDGRQQYYQNSLYWVIWYLGIPAVLLGAFGLAVLARRGLRALLTWQDATEAVRVWALPGMIALWVIVTVLYRPAVSPDQPWASRRLVPFVLPGLILGAIWASVWLKERAGQLGRTRVTSAVVASCCVASLLIPAALTNLDIGVTKTATGRHLSAHGMAFRRIGTGELTAVTKLCAAIGPDASVVILDSLTNDRFAQLVRGMCDTPTAALTKATPATVSAVVAGIQGVGRHPVLLAENEIELASYGGAPREVREPADHAGGAQPDLAADPHLGHPLHGLAVRPRHHPARRRGRLVRPGILPGREHIRIRRGAGAWRSGDPARVDRAAVLQRGRARAARGRADLRRHGQERDQLRAARRRRRLDRPDAGPAAPRRARLPEPQGDPLPAQQRRGHRAPDRYPAGPGRHRGLDRRRPHLPERPYPRVHRHARRRPDHRPGGGGAHQRGRHPEDRPGAGQMVRPQARRTADQRRASPT